MSLVTLTSLDLVEIFVLGPHFVRVAQQRSNEALVERFERDDVLAVGQHHAADRHLVHLADGLADHGKGIVSDLPVRTEIVRTDDVAGVDFVPLDELVDLDGPRGLERDLLELLLRDLDESLLVEHVALHDVLVGDLLAGVEIDL
jgi:hypothetical protein